jgi:hypothetical protein
MRRTRQPSLCVCSSPLIGLPTFQSWLHRYLELQHQPKQPVQSASSAITLLRAKGYIKQTCWFRINSLNLPHKAATVLNSLPTPYTSSSFRLSTFVWVMTSSKFCKSIRHLWFAAPCLRLNFADTFQVETALTDEISSINLSFSLSKKDSLVAGSKAAMEGLESDMMLRPRDVGWASGLVVLMFQSLVGFVVVEWIDALKRGQISGLR